ncbi:MAG: hypothetical protein GY772_28145, partial [bacterium]|nr:hypothetical protein [bacterium]
MKDFFMACFDLVTLVQFPVPCWNANAGMDWPDAREHWCRVEEEEERQARALRAASAVEYTAPEEELPLVELDERDRLARQHQDEVLSEHEGEGLTPRRRQAILDEDASQEVLREAAAADAAMAREAASSPQGIAGPAPTPPSASASLGSTGTTGSFEVVPDPMAAVVSPTVSDEEVLLQPGRSLLDEERRMMLKGRLSEIRGLTGPVQHTPVAGTQAQGDVGDSAAHGSTVAPSPAPAGGVPPVGGAPPATPVAGETSGAQGIAGLALPIERRGAVPQTPHGSELPKTPTGLFAGTPVLHQVYTGLGTAVGSVSDESERPLVAGGVPVVGPALLPEGGAAAGG